MSVGTYSLAREGDKLLSPHFRVREFACRDGADLVKMDTTVPSIPQGRSCWSGSALPPAGR